MLNGFFSFKFKRCIDQKYGLFDTIGKCNSRKSIQTWFIQRNSKQLDEKVQSKIKRHRDKRADKNKHMKSHIMKGDSN